MADIIPFRGIRYNTDRIAGGDVVAPPYDIISPGMREALYDKSPYNVVRIDFGKELPGDNAQHNKYLRAGAFLDAWLQQGTLIADPVESLYGYEIAYRCEGESRRLRGVVALVRLQELGTTVFPHEETYAKPKADRLQLIRACSANTSPIYSLYHSEEKTASRVIDNLRGDPCVEARDSDDAVHRLFPITGPSLIARIVDDLRDKDIFIADGHHRYEVALEYKKQMATAAGEMSLTHSAARPWDYVMMFLANMADDGITILPTHRLVKGISRDVDIPARLRPDFEVSSRKDADDLVRSMRHSGKGSFGLFDGRSGRFYHLNYRGDELSEMPAALRDLDVVVLHELIFRRDLGANQISYEMAVDEAVRRTSSGDYDAAFFLNSTTVREIERVAADRLRMPPKSTYFYPKLFTGMVINSHKLFRGGSHGN